MQNTEGDRAQKAGGYKVLWRPSLVPNLEGMFAAVSEQLLDFVGDSLLASFPVWLSRIGCWRMSGVRDKLGKWEEWLLSRREEAELSHRRDQLPLTLHPNGFQEGKIVSALWEVSCTLGVLMGKRLCQEEGFSYDIRYEAG